MTSCNKDDDGNSSTNEDDLIGVWTINSANSNADISINGVSIVDYFMDTFDLTEAEAEEFASLFEFELSGTIEFNSNGTYVADIEDGTETGTWELNNNTITMDKGTEDEVDFQIKSLTSSKLVIEFSETSSDEDIDEDGTPETMKVDMHLELSK
jgi:hypothetical protein